VANTGSAGQVLIDSDTESPGERRRTGKGHIDSYGHGRVCAASGCTTKLSQYNSGIACSLHDKIVVSVSHWTR
jgi:hypothetical protein